MKIKIFFCLAMTLALAASAYGQAQERVDELIKQLGSFPDYDAIRAASEELYQIGPPAAPDLIKALQNSDPGIRKEAARLLGDLKIKEAIVPLSKLIKDNKDWVVRSVVYSLGNIADPAAVAPLKEALKHYDESVREAALYSLDELQAESALPDIARVMLEDNDQYVRWRAMMVMKSIKEGSEVEAITRALRDPGAEAKARRNAASFVGDLKVDSALPLLVTAFEAKDENLRWRAVEAAGKIGNPAARKAIEGKLKDPSRDVRMFAISSLAELGDEASVPPLAAMLSQKSPEIKKNAIRSLRKIGGASAAAAVRNMLTDPDKYIRAQAVETLAEMGDGKAVKQIRLLASDRSPVVRAAVMHALGELGDGSDIYLLKTGSGDKNFWVSQEAERALAKVQSD